jgi:hypothetical protein
MLELAAYLGFKLGMPATSSAEVTPETVWIVDIKKTAR